MFRISDFVLRILCFVLKQIMPTPVEQVKERLNITDVVSSYLPLAKAGVNLKGRCPFHNEKTPSFFVSPSRQSFHCFGCGKGGDIITFVQEIEGLEFLDALKLLADRAGITLDLKSGGQASATTREKAALSAVLEQATRFYEKKLTEHPEALAYLTGRGLAKATITNFRLGFAPSGWRHLTDYLLGEGLATGLLDKAGLVVMKDKAASGPSAGAPLERPCYDRFRGRIMFPLLDAGGTVAGFSGRLYDPEGRRNEEAKYLNSPQTILYDKSRLLYGLDKAKLSIRREDKAVLVEGQMDLVLAHQIGLENTVAVSGTALTDRHLAALARLSRRLIMAYDADEAGLAASRRAV